MPFPDLEEMLSKSLHKVEFGFDRMGISCDGATAFLSSAHLRPNCIGAAMTPFGWGRQRMKRFCTTGLCVPQKHYMVDISARVARIMAMVERGDYFVINRGRQYGKTTTLNELAKALTGQGYQVIKLDFQEISTEKFASENTFCKAVLTLLKKAQASQAIKVPRNAAPMLTQFESEQSVEVDLTYLFNFFDAWFNATRKEVVFIIDEVDVASDSQAFLDFLAILRARFLQHQADERAKTFQSVILAGVSDIRHLKAKIRPEAQRKVNSPWNIAVPFDIPMELSAEGIRGMLDDYESDHHTGMDTADMAQCIEDYTGGYPFLVSRICQLLDESLVQQGMLPTPATAWTRHGVSVAVRELLMESNTLFQSLMGTLVNFPELKESLRRVLFDGDWVPFNSVKESILQMSQHGFIRRGHNGGITVTNRIFETLLYNYFLSEDGDGSSGASDPRVLELFRAGQGLHGQLQLQPEQAGRSQEGLHRRQDIG